MIDFFFNIWEKLFYGDRLGGRARSIGWRKVRREHIEGNSECAVCYKEDTLEVHHIIPFHVAPEKELDHTNLITLCRDCHLFFGHLNNFKSYNHSVVSDAILWKLRIQNRP